MRWLRGERELSSAARGHCLVRLAATALCSRNINIGVAGVNVRWPLTQAGKMYNQTFSAIRSSPCYLGAENAIQSLSDSGSCLPEAESKFQDYFQHLPFSMGFPSGSEVQETQVWSLGQEDSLEKDMATHSSILAWRTTVGRVAKIWTGWKQLSTKNSF